MVRRFTNAPILRRNPPRTVKSDQGPIYIRVPSTAFNDILARLNSPVLWKAHRRVLHYCSFRRTPERDQVLKGLVRRLRERVRLQLFLRYANIVLTCPIVHRPYRNTHRR